MSKLKMISWNVNGLRACMGKGFMDFFDEVNADIFCLQETKLQEGAIDWNKEGYVDFGQIIFFNFVKNISNLINAVYLIVFIKSLF